MADATDQKPSLKDANTPEEVWNAIKEILAALTRLQIKTSVTEYTSADQEARRELELCTTIDLLQADREYKIHESFLKDPTLAPLRDFHAEQVKLAEQEVQRRFEFIQNLGMAIVNAMNNTK